MKRFLLPLAAVTIAGLLLPAGARPAYACFCAALTSEEQVEQADLVLVGTVGRVTFERPPSRVDSRPPARRVAGHEPNFIGKVLIDVDRYFKGSGGSQLLVEQRGVSFSRDAAGNLVGLELVGGPNCALFGGLPMGERYLLYLHTTEPGAYQTSWCSGSIRLDASRLSYAYQSSEVYAAQLSEHDAALGLPSSTLWTVAMSTNEHVPELSSLGTPPSDQSGEGVPWLPIIIASSVGAAALAAASALLLRRRLTRR